MLRWLRGAAAKTTSANRLLEEGVTARDRGDNAAASAAFEAALRQDPDQVDALRLLGLIESSTGRSQTGLAKLERACALQPQAGINHYTRHQALRSLDEIDAAVDALTQAVACADADSDWQIELGLMQESAGRAAEALNTWRQAAGAFPDEAVSWWERMLASIAGGEQQTVCRDMRCTGNEWTSAVIRLTQQHTHAPRTFVQIPAIAPTSDTHTSNTNLQNTMQTDAQKLV